jgi:hypothetical protein
MTTAKVSVARAAKNMLLTHITLHKFDAALIQCLGIVSGVNYTKLHSCMMISLQPSSCSHLLCSHIVLTELLAGYKLPAELSSFVCAPRFAARQVICPLSKCLCRGQGRLYKSMANCTLCGCCSSPPRGAAAASSHRSKVLTAPADPADPHGCECLGRGSADVLRHVKAAFQA